jgi:hypothetical protein
MNKKIILIGALLVTTLSANAGVFGAKLKPVPSITLFGQTLSWAIPSLCAGKAAGVLPDASISAKGITFKVPYLAIELPFPLLTLAMQGTTVELKLGEVTKHKQEEATDGSK